MRLLVTGRNIDITPALRQLIERKLSKLDRVLNDSAMSAQVILRMEKYRRVADLTIHARGDHMLHGIGEGAEWPASIRQAIDKIDKQAHKLKSKWTTRKRRATGGKAIAPASALRSRGARWTSLRVTRERASRASMRSAMRWAAPRPRICDWALPRWTSQVTQRPFRDPL